MFVLDELDRILQNLTTSNKEKRDKDRLRISLPDVTRIVLDYKELDKLIIYPSDMTYGTNSKPKKAFEKLMESNQNDLSSDSLFVSMMNRMILSRLTQIPERHYPCARLIICDRYSYDLLMKLKRISPLKSSDVSSDDIRNFIYKPPSNVTAIFLLRDVIDMIDREQESIVVQKRDSGKQALQYNYPLIRRVFPYLRMSDLIIILRDRGELDLDSFDINACREHQMLQYFNHFARSSILIEMNALSESTGYPHLIYDNVLISQPPPETADDGGDAQPSSLRFTLVKLALMAKQLMQVLDKLSIRLSSISYRKNDPNNQTRLLAQLLSTSTTKSPRHVTNDLDHRLGRVLIIDRYYDFQQAFFHADRYGPFLEQEKQVRSVENKADIKLQPGAVDDLEGKLQLEKLTDVLSEILRYTANLKPKGLKPLNTNNAVNFVQPKQSLAKIMASSQSIARHLDTVKFIYRCLSEGYLLTLRLEYSLELMTTQLKDLVEPMTSEQQDEMVGKLQRVAAAFGQLVRNSGKVIRPSDIIRVACILVDTINLFFHKNSGGTIGGKISTILNDIRGPLLSARYMKKVLKAKLDEDDDVKAQFNAISSRMYAFDLISRGTCGQRSRESLEQIVEGVYRGNLDQDAYPMVKLLDSTTNAEAIVLVFLGSLTPNELGKIKAFEADFKARTTYFEILVMTYDMKDPEDILKIL